MHPTIGITANHRNERHSVGIAYSNAVISAGGFPIILPPILGMEPHFITMCDGFIFTGGDDPKMEQWGVPTHSNVTPVSVERQTFELALLEQLQSIPTIPVLGVCLGMQWMGLLAGGCLDQDLAPLFAQNHCNGTHSVEGEIGEGRVHSNHHQAMTDPGSLDIIARSNDGLIEAIQDRTRSWYVGVQWHPERTDDALLGQGIFDQLVQASITRKEVTL